MPKLHWSSFAFYIMLRSKIEKVPRGIRGEKPSKDMASSRNLVSDNVTLIYYYVQGIVLDTRVWLFLRVKDNLPRSFKV